MRIGEQVRSLIIAPSLRMAGLWSESAEMLVYGTGMVESNYQYIKQINGPALSFWQIEPITHLSIKRNLLSYKNDQLRARILAACYLDVLPADEALISNMRYACLICRLVYLRAPEALPRANNALALSQYHKLFYNSLKGKADVTKNAIVFEGLIKDSLHV